MAKPKVDRATARLMRSATYKGVVEMADLKSSPGEVGPPDRGEGTKVSGAGLLPPIPFGPGSQPMGIQVGSTGTTPLEPEAAKFDASLDHVADGDYPRKGRK